MLCPYNTQTLIQAITSDPTQSSPRIIFPPKDTANDSKKRSKHQVRHFRLNYLLECQARLGLPAFLRENGEKQSIDFWQY